MISKLKEVVDEVSSLTTPDAPHVIAHYLKHLHHTLVNPQKPTIRIPHFGVFYSTRSRIDHYILRLISKMRKSKTPQLVEKFRVAWAHRHKVYAYDLSRDFKTRYKSWHNNVKKLEWKN